ncbi:MAG: hypothetical protein JWM80_3850 [Cyanobacteria bacterium RYN_339]|nr:hypothetical protein [Cyanobacteria bacterium RYN_339]
MRAWSFPFLALLLAGCTPSGVGTITTLPDALPGVSHEQTGGFSIRTRSGVTLVTDLPAAGLEPRDRSIVTTARAAPGDPVDGTLVIADPAGGTPTEIPLTTDDFDPKSGQLLRSLALAPGALRDISIFLRDGNGKLVGSAYKKGVAATSGAPDVQITWNREIPQIVGAQDGLKVSDGIVIKLATLDLQSGMADGQPGVDHVDVEVSGEAYGDGTASGTIGTFKAPSLLAYSWSPGKPSGTFLPDLLRDGNKAIPFVLTTKTYSVDGRLVGVDRLRLAMIGTASVNVDFQPPTGPVTGTRIFEP